ncbi:MAG: hypothetical protein RLZZ415_1020 [Pseudomonadota bacterium]|jgi:prepilin peptidase CpaA
MPNVEFQYVLLGALAIALVIAAITDIRRRQIDNWLNAAIALAAPLYWWASGLNLWPGVAWQLGIAALTFAICAGLFALRAMGGGDVKLLAALALWITLAWFLKLIFMMSLLGGLLALALGIGLMVGAGLPHVVVSFFINQRNKAFNGPRHRV